MKFGLYSSIANPPRGEHLDRSIDEVIAEAQLAEASGFDSCFFGEHHQDKDGFLPSPLIVATAVAAQTRRLNVGTSVISPPTSAPSTCPWSTAWSSSRRAWRSSASAGAGSRSPIAASTTRSRM